ncbi:hypothetical protein ACF09E_07665 [Streptomyces sp. NPDC014891]|uniref:hypothetical protein n=1 Tax=Streptomyces sp. NPDC014891 TaxID=3364929 RepID=UPI0036FD25FA
MQREAATEVFKPLQADDPPVVAAYRLGEGDTPRHDGDRTAASTALPGSGINFLTGDLTVWRAP